MTDRPPRRGLAVFEAPPLPDGWHGRDVVRIIDPLGIQAAWVAPRRAGGLIAWFARNAPGEAWIEVVGGMAGCLGGELLVREPDTGFLKPVTGTSAGWTFTERDPTAVTVSGLAAGRHLEISIRCDDGLHVALGGDAAAEPGFRLHARHAVAAAPEVTATGGGVRFGPGPVAGLAWRHGPGLRAHPGNASGTAGWHLDILPREHGGGANEGSFAFVLTAITSDG